ncbi:MAG TPA: hypothetical protein VGT41_03990 [Candidatus Babeliales bacterium]|nr:hypothetical protein [Candidatus Babeliales bacterium]
MKLVVLSIVLVCLYLPVMASDDEVKQAETDGILYIMKNPLCYRIQECDKQFDICEICATVGYRKAIPMVLNGSSGEAKEYYGMPQEFGLVSFKDVLSWEEDEVVPLRVGDEELKLLFTNKGYTRTSSTALIKRLRDDFLKQPSCLQEDELRLRASTVIVKGKKQQMTHGVSSHKLRVALEKGQSIEPIRLFKESK